MRGRLLDSTRLQGHRMLCPALKKRANGALMLLPMGVFLETSNKFDLEKLYMSQECLL